MQKNPFSNLKMELLISIFWKIQAKICCSDSEANMPTHNAVSSNQNQNQMSHQMQQILIQIANYNLALLLLNSTASNFIQCQVVFFEFAASNRGTSGKKKWETKEIFSDAIWLSSRYRCVWFSQRLQDLSFKEICQKRSSNKYPRHACLDSKPLKRTLFYFFY